MKNKNNDDFDFKFDMLDIKSYKSAQSKKIHSNENESKALGRNVEDTLKFCEEASSLKSLKKLVSETKNRDKKDNGDKKSEEDDDTESSYNKFLTLYSKRENEEKKEDKNDKSKNKRTRRIETDVANEFLSDIQDNHEVFDYDYSRPGTSFGKIFMSLLLVVFAGVIAFLVYRVNYLNTKVADLKKQVEDADKDKDKLQETLIENENMKKMIEKLSNGEPITLSDNGQTDTQDNNSGESEYIVQKGDTLSSISQKVYGSSVMYTKIMERNGLSSENLSENQRLIIPKNN